LLLELGDSGYTVYWLKKMTILEVTLHGVDLRQP